MVLLFYSRGDLGGHLLATHLREICGRLTRVSSRGYAAALSLEGHQVAPRPDLQRIAYMFVIRLYGQACLN
jgi:hypothetical protein